MIRRILTRLIRASELSPSLLVVLAILSVVVAWFQDVYAPVLGETIGVSISIAAYVLSGLLLLPIIVKDLNIWRLVPPKYDGIEGVFGHISENASVRECLFFGADGRIRIDAARFLERSSALLARVDFVGGDAALQQRSAEINSQAFSGSRYGLGFENKLARNSDIAERNPVSFALLQNENTTATIGLASTIPLSTASVAAYVAGQVSDNDFNSEMVALPGDRIGAVVFFLIAHDRRNRIVRADESLSSKVLGDLVILSVIQTIIIALGTPSQERFLVLAANSNPKLKRLFGRLKLKERTDLVSADQEEIFGNYVYLRDLGRARRILRDRWPDIAKIIQSVPAGRALQPVLSEVASKAAQDTQDEKQVPRDTS